MVYDLDTALFNGALKGNMRFTWEGTYNYRIVDYNPNATVDYKYQPQCIASRPTYQKTGFEIFCSLLLPVSAYHHYHYAPEAASRRPGAKLFTSCSMLISI
jgi:hypothetical protein